MQRLKLTAAITIENTAIKILHISYTDTKQLKLSEFLSLNGIDTKAADLQIAQEINVSVKLTSETDFGKALIPLLTGTETLSEANTLCGLLNVCTEQRRTTIYDELQSGNADTILTILESIKELNSHTKTPNIERTDYYQSRKMGLVITRKMRELSRE
jgi:hypothetical protein